MLYTLENLDNQDFEFLNILENLLKSSDYMKNLLKELNERLTILFKTKNLPLQMNLDYLDISVQRLPSI